MEYAINMRGVSKQYYGFALDHIDFQVPKGCVVGLIGENGAGKTTLIKAALGLINIDEGDIRIQGRSMKDDEIGIKEEIGVVFDENSFPETLNLKTLHKIMPSIFRKWDAQRFEELAGRFGLPFDKKIKDFSKGMKMKLNIAAALSHDAKLLILDEATGGLDPVVRDEILDLFLEFMQEEDHSVLISSHITSDIEKIADYIAFIRNGKIVFFQNKDELLYQYGILKCSEKDLTNYDASYYVAERKGAFQCEVLINNKNEFVRKYPDSIVDPVTVEAVMLFYVKGELV